MSYILSGTFLIFWAVLNTAVDLREYGWAEGNYFWFCNLALFGMGLALILRSRGLLTGFFSIALFTQTFWLIDNFYRQTTGLSLFGLTDFMYRPGYPLAKFILSHYHYFTLFIGFYVLCVMPKEKNQTILLVSLFNPLIFAVSYFAFSPSKNVNCIHSSCLPELIPGEGPVFSILFWVVVFIVHLTLAALLDRFFLGLDLSAAAIKRLNVSFVFGLLVALGLSVHDVKYRLSLPSFVCAETQDKKGIKTGCIHTKPYSDEEFTLSYFVENRGIADRVCRVSLKFNDQEKEIESGINLLIGRKIHFSSLLPILKKDLRVEVKPQCHIPIDRDIASASE